MLKTSLHNAHSALGAKMGEFAGYDMPLYYKEGVIKEHEWVRAKAGVFDVSHMGQISIKGEGVAEFLETLTPSAFQPKNPGRAQYTVLLNEDGGIIDDLIISRLAEDEFFAVINAGCKQKDVAWIKQNLPEDLSLTLYEERALIALQGPKAEYVLKEVAGIDAADLPYMHMMHEQVLSDADIWVSRVGYTGEDGFELSIASDKASDLWDKLLAHADVKPIGLAARDSLRLEMGYALYGHDIDATTSPVEAGSTWIISKKTTGYLGYDRIQKELSDGPSRILAGVKLTGKGVAREGAELRNERDEKIGVLTSGSYSPSLKQSIGQGYVDPAYKTPGTKILVNVRGRNIEAEIAPLPFVAAKTKSMKKKDAA